MGFKLTSNFVFLALCSLAQLTNLSYGAPTKGDHDACAALLKYADEKAIKVPAKEAYDCLLSPPFNHTRSENVYHQMRNFANILSSQAFFNKPEGLPLIVDRVDLNGTFDAIKKKLDSKKYGNDYSFNRDITEIFGGFHDGHTFYFAFCQSVFGGFVHDYPLVSIVPPGEDVPRIYLADPKTGEVGEEIVEIAGEKALDHMLKLVKVLKGPFDAGWIDADTRWNGLFMDRGALAVKTGNFAARDMYPGPDFKMKTHSGKVIDVQWYVEGPGTWGNPDFWKVLFESTSSFVNTFCLNNPTGSTTEHPPTETTTNHEDEDEPDYDPVETEDPHPDDDGTEDPDYDQDETEEPEHNPDDETHPEETDDDHEWTDETEHDHEDETEHDHEEENEETEHDHEEEDDETEHDHEDETEHDHEEEDDETEHDHEWTEEDDEDDTEHDHEWTEEDDDETVPEGPEEEEHTSSEHHHTGHAKTGSGHVFKGHPKSGSGHHLKGHPKTGSGHHLKGHPKTGSGHRLKGHSKTGSGHHLKGHPSQGASKSPDFHFLEFINHKAAHRLRSVKRDLDADLRKILKARDGNTVGDFSSLVLTDIPPAAYPEVETRMKGTEQSLHFLKAYPDIAVWGIHSFASRESKAPNAAQFFYYWRHYMLENLKLLKEKKVKRLILDLSSNGGGTIAYGMETVRRFFPEAEPFYGVDYRRTPLVDQFLILTNETAGLNKVDGTPFKSMDDFLNPPVAKKGDYFTKIGRVNQLGDAQQFIPDVQFTTKGDPPFSLENIVILTDGQCGSTCAITVEALSSLGVATVVTGGQPSKEKPKTMQYIGGIKGYQVLTFEDANRVYESDPTGIDTKYAVRPVDIKLQSNMNLRNSYTPDDPIIPQEFIFQPADAHIWYTKQMINDRTILWNDVVKLTWDEKGKNKLLKSHTDSKKHAKQGGHHHHGPPSHVKQPKAGYPGQRTRETLREGVLADFKYLATGWLTGWSGKNHD